MNVLTHRDLQARGIRWTRQHLHRLAKAGKFPQPFKLGDRTNAWTEDQINEYLEQRVAQRDMKTASP
jgi:predicted DNA-binding transcriptional regulator AlpA